MTLKFQARGGNMPFQSIKNRQKRAAIRATTDPTLCGWRPIKRGYNDNFVYGLYSDDDTLLAMAIREADTETGQKKWTIEIVSKNEQYDMVGNFPMVDGWVRNRI
jgi:phosphotransacetylase